MATQHERMDSNLIYDPADADILSEQIECLNLLYEYNQTRPTESTRRAELLRQMFGAIGDGCHIEAPFYANWGGKHVFMGNDVYANFNLTLVDDGNIYIGDKVMFGPNVMVATANHPLLPELRERGLQYNLDVHIERNVWIGGNAVIVPGITIGENSVIGAGSVVTKDIPANVIAAGNPCRVLRSINENDRHFYYRDRRIDWENLAL